MDHSLSSTQLGRSYFTIIHSRTLVRLHVINDKFKQENWIGWARFVLFSYAQPIQSKQEFKFFFEPYSSFILCGSQENLVLFVHLRGCWWLAVCVWTMASSKLSKPRVCSASKKYTNNNLPGSVICCRAVWVITSSVYLPEMCWARCVWYSWWKTFGKDCSANGKDAYNLWNKGM